MSTLITSFIITLRQFLKTIKPPHYSMLKVHHTSWTLLNVLMPTLPKLLYYIIIDLKRVLYTIDTDVRL